jgi:hypothetical protein
MLSFQLLIHNHLDVRHANSLTATSIRPSDRTVKLDLVTPATTSEWGLFEQTHPGATGSLVLTQENMSCTFTFGTVIPPSISPVIAGKQEITLSLDNWAFSTGATKELVVTNDATN